MGTRGTRLAFENEFLYPTFTRLGGIKVTFRIRRDIVRHDELSGIAPPAAKRPDDFKRLAIQNPDSTIRAI